MKEIELTDLSYNVGVLTSIAKWSKNQHDKKELLRIASELRRYIKQEIPSESMKYFKD